MRYELTDCEWTAIRPMLPNKPRGMPRVNDRRVLDGIFWVLRSGAPGNEAIVTSGRRGATCRTTRSVHHLLLSLRSLATSGRLGQDHERTRRRL